MNRILTSQPSIKIRVLLASAGLILLVLEGFLFLNPHVIAFISDGWLKVLEMTITILGVLGTFGQWLFPFPPLERVPTNYQYIFCQQVKKDLNKLLGRGALVFFTTEREVGHEINLVPQFLWHRSPPDQRDQLIETRKEIARRHRVGSGMICAAVFRELDPDDYMAWSDVNQPTSVPVFANEVTPVDRR